MSARIRGQEVTIRIAVDGQIQDGSFFKVEDFEIAPRADIKETDFLGEDETDLDFQHHGFDFRFSVHHQDQKVLDFLSTIISRHEDHLRHPEITMTVIYDYREPSAEPQFEEYHSMFLRPTSTGFKGRKEYVTSDFEGKCKKRSQLAA